MSDYNFEQGGQPTRQMRPQGYQPRPPIGYGLMQSFGARRPLETKPFFLTSEFVFSLFAALKYRSIRPDRSNAETCSRNLRGGESRSGNPV